MVYDYSNIEKVFLVGDIHGEFNDLFNRIKQFLSNKKSLKDEKIDENECIYAINHDHEIDELAAPIALSIRKKDNPLKQEMKYDNSLFIVAGDCGFGFNKHQYYIDVLKKINEVLSDNNSHIIFVRGNHDDPSYFNEEKLFFSNIKCVPDYSVIKTKNFCTLCIGGAISIDRTWRKSHEYHLNKYSKNKDKKLYWEDEQVIFDIDKLKELIENGIKIDSVVTHSSPKNMYPLEKDNYKHWLKIDKNLKKDVSDEREFLYQIYMFLLDNKIDIKFWGYGHFHSLFYGNTDENIPFIALPCNYSIIDINEHINKMKNKKEPRNFFDFGLLNTITF